MTGVQRRAFIAAAGGTAVAGLLPAGNAEALAPSPSGDARGVAAETYAAPSSPRATWSLNQGWRAVLGDPANAQQPSFDDSAWEPVDVPHPLKLQPVNVGRDNLQTVAWLRRRVTVPNSARGQRLLLRFEGAMQVAEVYVDGTRLGVHHGGFTPFGWDVTGHLQPGRAAVLAVRLDNTDQPTVPPGKPQSGLDFNYHGGLYRDVSLTAAHPVHITDPIVEGRVAGGGVFVTTPEAGRDAATVNVATDVINGNAAAAKVAVSTVVTDAAGRTVATAASEPATVAAGATATFPQTLTVDAPHLWAPDTPYLYTAHVEVRVAGAVVDQVSTRFGIRTLSWTYESGFSLNGTRLLLNGTNRGHQEYPYVGFAAPASQQRRDAVLIRESGANFVRSAHYPPHPAFLDACDEVGLTVLNCVPGWQYWNADPLFAQRAHDDLRTMIRRDRNHPSVILWEATLNETYSGNSPFEADQQRIAQEEYHGNQMCTYGGNGTFDAKIFTVQNAYWVRPSPDDPVTESPGAALLYREYGDYEFGGDADNSSRTTRADGPQAMLATVRNKQSEFSAFQEPAYFGSGALAGLATWSATDYTRGSQAKTCYSGLMDLFRVPKFVYYFYQSQRDPHVRQAGVGSGPMLYVANYWNEAFTDLTVPNTAVGTGQNQWQYHGDWQGTSGDNSYSNTAGDTAVLRFTGTSVTLYGDLDRVHGIGTVTLDSQPPQNVDFYAAGRQNQVAVWKATDLAEGPHTLTVTVTGTGNPASSDTYVALTRAVVSGSPNTVVVFSNCDEVELRRDGEAVARQRPDTGGINAHVPHPPFTFTVDFEPGELTATGYLDGRPAVSRTVRTPGSAARIDVTVDLPDGRLVADGTDFAVVRAMVVDAHGTVVRGNDVPVTFRVDGAGALIGDAGIGANPVTATAGIATALVRAGRRPGRITITASAPGLAAGTAAFTTAADVTPRI
jgi:beta-galactosidase